jgi:hypothetical protein
MQLWRASTRWETRESTSREAYAHMQGPPNGETFLSALLDRLRAQVSGASPGAVRHLPRSPNELRAELRDIGEKAIADAAIQVTTRGKPSSSNFGTRECIHGPYPLPDAKTAEKRVSALKGQVAQALGAAIEMRRNDPTPRLINGAPFSELARILGDSRSSMAPTAWKLQVDREVQGIDLCIEHQGTWKSLGPVLSLSSMQGGDLVLRLDRRDGFDKQILNRAIWRGSRFVDLTPATDRPIDPKLLASVDIDESIYVLGHGGGPDAGLVFDKEDLVTTRMGGMTPEALAERLMAAGLPEGFQGTVYLEGCFSGAGGQSEAVYALQLRKALAAAGRVGLTVAGRPGLMWFSANANCTFPMELTYGVATALARSLRKKEQLVTMRENAIPEQTEWLDRELARERELGALSLSAAELMRDKELSGGECEFRDFETLAVREMWVRFGHTRMSDPMEDAEQ